MKAFARLFPVAAALAGLASAARAEVAAPKDAASRLSLIGDDYRKVAVLPESLFNPFKIHATNLANLDRNSDAKVTDQTILDAIEQRGVSGLLCAPQAGDSRVIIGDQVFGVGDELSFAAENHDEDAPLVLGATVVLRTVAADRLAFEVSFEGESAHLLDFPLSKFWRP